LGIPMGRYSRRWRRRGSAGAPRRRGR